MTGHRQRHAPLAPLLEICERRWRPTSTKAAELAGAPIKLAEVLDRNIQTVSNWIQNGTIPERAAEQSAHTLGLHPVHIWGHEWWNHVGIDLEETS